MSSRLDMMNASGRASSLIGEDQPGKFITDLTEIANRGLIVDRYFTSPYAFAGQQISISGINIEFVNVTLIAIKVLTCGLWLT